MISEKQLAESFDSFWQQHFPLLNPTFIRQINLEKQRVVARDSRPMLPVPMGKEIDRFDLVAELAFEAAREGYRTKRSLSGNFEQASARAMAKIAKFTGVSEIPPPSSAETAEAKSLGEVYDAFFSSIPTNETVTFGPRVKGTGILDEMEADFCTSTTLFEVKAVNRNLQSNDLRQVLCYLFAALGSHQYSWTDYCIFNPRLAVFTTGKVDTLLSYISGRNSYDCISDVLDALMEREQPLESRF